MVHRNHKVNRFHISFLIYFAPLIQFPNHLNEHTIFIKVMNLMDCLDCKYISFIKYINNNIEVNLVFVRYIFGRPEVEMFSE